MGINIDRFIGDVDSNFICSICNDVLEDPLQAPICEHAFCKICISQWLDTNHSCPLDREQLIIGDLRPVSRILRSLLARLTLTCNNLIHGCPAIVALEELKTHLLECSFNPKRLVSCNSGCGITMCFDELANHICVQTENENKMSKMESKLADFRLETEDQIAEILGINNNLVEKLERFEKANEDKILLIESKLEFLDEEMATRLLYMKNSLHLESATLKQRQVEAERRAAEEIKWLREQIYMTYARLIIFVLLGLWFGYIVAKLY
ncbi:E3 ubiquitin-protein ligase NRDP1-like isoform X2 [Artemia franciscana]